MHMHKLFAWLANSMALLGGLVLTALIMLTCVSVIGRGSNTLGHAEWFSGIFPELAKTWLNSGIGPITGDFELVEAGIAFAIFAFLPICQLRGGHASVDIFASFMPERFNRFLITLWEIVLAVIMILISQRLFAGMQDKLNYNETTFLLQFPLGWAYAVSFMAAVIAAIVAIYCAIVRIQTFLQGKADQSVEGKVH